MKENKFNMYDIFIVIIIFTIAFFGLAVVMLKINGDLKHQIDIKNKQIEATKLEYKWYQDYYYADVKQYGEVYE